MTDHIEPSRDPASPTLRKAAAQQILDDERSAATAEHNRLQTIIDTLAGERAILAAERERLHVTLQQIRSAADQWKSLQDRREELADDMSDQIVVRLEDYQDDGSGRLAVCLQHDEITIDLSDDDYIPATVIVAKPLSDTDTARFLCRLQAESLRYSVEYL